MAKTRKTFTDACLKEDSFTILNALDGPVLYEFAGECNACGERLYETEHPDNADEKLPDNVALRLPKSHNVYCGRCIQDHIVELTEPAYMVYEEVGRCIVCGTKLFSWRDGYPEYDAMGDQTMCRTRSGDMYCKPHYLKWLKDTDPDAYMDFVGIKREPDGMVVDKWQKEHRLEIKPPGAR